MKASEKREEQLGDNLLDEMRRVQRKAWELLARTESEGDHRASIVRFVGPDDEPERESP